MPFSSWMLHWGSKDKPLDGEVTPEPDGWLMNFLQDRSDDLAAMAKKITKPKSSQKYRDGKQVVEAFSLAKATMDKADWKHAHKLRRKARQEWCAWCRQRILEGDWTAYHERKRDKHRRPGWWWGRLLQEKTEDEITSEVKQHLEDKMRAPTVEGWDDVTHQHLRELPDDGGWCPFSWEDVARTIGDMKKGTAVGPDGVCVDLLAKIIEHEDLGRDLLQLVNHTIQHTLAPASWDVSLLALLAKVETPLLPKDLRTISMSSSIQKCINKLVMSRVFPCLLRLSSASCCGPGRQSADLIGSVTSLRDNVREWKLPIVCAKLDVNGAFDKVQRTAAAELIVDRTRNHFLNTEVRWLVRQLGTNILRGSVPGGLEVEVQCTQGIKQGAPESAELFGLLMADQIDAVLESATWERLGGTWGDAPLNLLFYQDDIFGWDETAPKLEQRIREIAKALARLGLELAEDKTQVIASPHYHGGRSLGAARSGGDTSNRSHQRLEQDTRGASMQTVPNGSLQIV